MLVFQKLICFTFNGKQLDSSRNRSKVLKTGIKFPENGQNLWIMAKIHGFPAISRDFWLNLRILASIHGKLAKSMENCKNSWISSKISGNFIYSGSTYLFFRYIMGYSKKCIGSP
jgi:hypothetical protein